MIGRDQDVPLLVSLEMFQQPEAVASLEDLAQLVEGDRPDIVVGISYRAVR